MTTKSLLIIDDDQELCLLLSEYLGMEDFNISSVHTGTDGVTEALSGRHDIVVLDVMLPGLDGFGVLKEIRKTSRLPVIMLTARGDDVDRIVGLEIGADDYLPKPFNPRELLARIKAILRRSEGTRKMEHRVLKAGDIRLDTSSMKLFMDDREIRITAMEFGLLETLVRARGNTVSREDLSRKVLGREHSPFDRSLDVHISNLRKKLGKEATERILAIRGEGYLFREKN